MALRNPQDIAQELARQRVQQTALQRFGQSAWNSFKQAPQQLGTAVGTAITSRFELGRQNMEAATDRRIQDTLRLQQQRALKTGNIDQARQLSQRSAYYGDRTANNLQGFGENISQQRNNAIAGTVGTGLQLLGAKGMTPVKALQATAIPTVFGGGFAALTGGDVASGAGQGLGQSLQLAGINKITDPLLAGAQIGRLKFKGLNPAIAKMPLAKRALIKAGASGVINTAENELQTRVNEQRGQTPQEIALSFGMGAATGAGGEVVPAAWKAGKEAVKESDINIKKKYLTDAFYHQEGLEKVDGKQGRVPGTERFDKKVKLTRAAGTFEVIDDQVAKFLVKLPGQLDEIKLTAREIVERKIPVENVLRPANDVAKGFSRKAYSGGFIKPDEFIPGATSKNKILYHGTNDASAKSIQETGFRPFGLDPAKGDDLSGLSVSLTDDPKIARQFAEQKAKTDGGIPKVLQVDASQVNPKAGTGVLGIQDREYPVPYEQSKLLKVLGEYNESPKNIKPSEFIPSTKATPTGRIQEPTKGLGKYKIIKQEGIVEVDGTPVKIAEGIDTFIHEGTNGWVVSEKTSGQYMASGVTKQEAINKAKQAVNDIGINKVQKIIAKKTLPQPTKPVIDRTKLSGRQLDMTNAQLKEANQFQSDMEAQALNTQKTNTTSGTQTGKRPEVSQLFRAPEDLSPSQTSSPARENLSRLIQTRPEVFSKTGKSSQKSLVSSLPPEHYTELQQSFKDRTPDQKVNIIDYLRTPEKVLQKIGLGKEAELLKKQYNNYLDELPKEIGKITEWSKRVSPGANEKIFRYLDGQKGVPLAPEELKVATEIQGYLKEWADKLDLPQDSRIASYITHIFEKDFIQKEFDPEIARMIQDRVPGSVYDPFLQKRLGELGYVEDTWRALDAYVKRATRKYNMDQALEPLQKAAERLDIDSYKYVERLGARINLRPTELDNLMDNTIKSLIGYKFGQRPVAAISRNIRQAVYRGTLGLNVGSAVRNLTQGVNTYSELGEKYTLKGYLSLARDIASGSDELTRVGVLRDDFIQDRALSATKQSLQKLDKGLFALFEAAERINRGAAYYGAKSRALSQGKSEQQAIQEAIKLVEKTQFRFGSVDTPVAMQSDLAKLILQFQSYALKQGEFLAGKVANKEYAGLIRYALGSFVLAKTVGTLIGMDITDMIPGYGIATGEQKIGQTPAFQFGSSVVSAATDQPDDYGNKRTFKEKALDIGESAVPLIPAGVQIKKTLQGLDAVRKGYSESASGRIQYVVPQDAPTAIRAGLLGKSKLPQAQEYFNNEESVLSEKQTELVKTSPDMMGAYQNVLKQRKVSREEDKAREQVRETSNIQEVGEKILYYKDGEVNSVDIGKITTMPEKTGYERILKQREAYSTLSALYQSDTVTQDIKEKALSQVGITKENMEYYLVAKENNDVKTAYVYDKITEFANNQDRQGFLQWLAENRKEINGSQVVSDGVVSQLKSDGLLSAQESKLLKQITVDHNGKRLSKVTGRKPKKLKSFKPPAFKAPKQKRLQVRKGTRLKAIKV